jgi:hypothetical protein
MNLFEFLAIILIIAGVIAGLMSGLGHGFIGALWAAAKGAAMGFGAYAVLLLSVLTLLALGLRYRPPFPICKNGRCSARNYTYLSIEGESKPPSDGPTGRPNEHGGTLARCRCGTLYLRRTTDRRVWEVSDDGTLIPYMLYRPFGRWRKVSS